MLHCTVVAEYSSVAVHRSRKVLYTVDALLYIALRGFSVSHRGWSAQGFLTSFEEATSSTFPVTTVKPKGEQKAF